MSVIVYPKSVGGGNVNIDTDISRLLPLDSIPSNLGTHEVVNVNGALFEGEPHAAEDRAVTLTELTHAMFLGFHRRQSGAQNQAGGFNNLVAGMFYLNTTYDDWEKYATQPGPGWSNFIPFRDGEVWAGKTFHSFVHGEAQAKTRATAVGQVFVDLTGSKVLEVTAYSNAVPAEVRPRLYDTLGFKNNPAAYWWGIGQSERNPNNFPNGVNGIRLRRLQFAIGDPVGTPHEQFFGWEDLGIGDIFVPTAMVSSDIDSVSGQGNTGGGLIQVVISPPTGLYNLDYYVDTSLTAETSFHSVLNRITSGNDDVEIHRSIGYATVEAGLRSVAQGGRLTIKDFRFDSAEQYYFALRGTSMPNEGNSRHALRLERTG